MVYFHATLSKLIKKTCFARKMGQKNGFWGKKIPLLTIRLGFSYFKTGKANF